MATAYLTPGEVVDISSNTFDDPQAPVRPLVETDGLEVFRLRLKAGEEKAAHQAPGPVVLICVQGRVCVEIEGASHEVRDGQMLYLSAGQTHCLRGLTDAVVVMASHPLGLPIATTQDIVQLASEDSFPASDSPSWIPTTGLGAPCPHEGACPDEGK